MKHMLHRLWNEEEGQDMTEYGLLLVLIALAIVASSQGVASGISAVFSEASSSLS